jgi:tetratricopeptide (TPR) repeat protein
MADPTSTHGELAPGTKVAGRYEIIGEIGAGGMGRVYRAVQHPLGSPACIKTLHTGAGQDPQFAARFEREARATSRLRHPHIVSVFDFGTHVDGSLYLVMELVDGKTLTSIAGKGQFVPAARAVRILSQVCDALTFAHRQGVVHRDLKLANVMVVDLPNEPDFVKVLDFGSALMLDAGEEGAKLTQAGMLIGTPAYMAPEYILGRGVDARVDVYAAGVMLYALLVGSTPFRGNAQAIYAQQVSIQPEAPRKRNPQADVSPAMERVVLRALAKDPARRYASADELKKALLDALARREEPEAAAAPSDTDRPGAIAVEVAREERPTIVVAIHAARAPDEASLVPIAEIARTRGGVLVRGEHGPRITFGLDRELPEAAADAVRCAMELASIAPASGSGRAYGVGVRDGQASCRGRFGDPGFEHEAFGEGGAIAERLAAHARPGTAIVSGPAARHVPPEVRLHPVPPLEGRDEPVFRLGDASADPESLKLAFVGRADAVRALLEVAARAAEGRVSVIEGPIGMGKSRVVREAVPAAARIGVQVAIVEASAVPGLHPSHAICQLAALGWNVPGAAATAAERYAVELMLGKAAASDDLAGERRQLRLVSAAIEGVARRVRHGPLVVVFDRLDAADDLTWAAARRLCDVASGLGVSVVLCVRKVAGIPFALGEGVGRIELPPLGSAEIQSLARSAGADVEDAALVVSASRGLPLLAEECLRSIGRGERESVVRAAELGAREALELLVTARFQTLPTGCRHVGEAAAVLGIEPLESEVMALSGETRPQAVQPLADAGILSRTANGRLRFAHAVVRSAVLASLERLARASVHHAAADLVAAAPDAARRAAERAEHLLQAGRRRDAFALLVSAADESQAEGAARRAADQLRVALEAAAGFGEELRAERAEAARKLGKILIELGRLEEAQQVLHDGFPVARSAGANDLAADLLRLHGRALALHGDGDGGRKEIESAYAFAEKRGFVAVAAEACGDLADAEEAAGKHDEATSVLKRGLDLLAGSEDAAASLVRIQLYNRLGRLDLRKGNVAGAIALFTQALDLAERLKDRHQSAGLLGNLGGTYAKQGQMDRALHFTERALRESEEIGDPIGVARQSFNLALLRLSLGHTDAARKLLRSSHDAATRAGWREGLAMSTAALAKVGAG